MGFHNLILVAVSLSFTFGLTTAILDPDADHLLSHHNFSYHLETTTTNTGRDNAYKLTEEEEKRILDKFNYGRRTVSPVAADMNYVEWDLDLERAAQDVLDECVSRLLQPEWFTNEQVVQYVGVSNNLESRLEDLIEELFDLGRYLDFSSQACSVDAFYCKMYRLITWYSMTYIGCAQQICNTYVDSGSGEEKRVIMWKCNFQGAGKYWSSVQQYTSGDPCTNCVSGSGWCSRNLCVSSCEGITPCECALDCSGHGELITTENKCTCVCDGEFDGSNCQIDNRSPTDTTSPDWPSSRLLLLDPCQISCPEGFLLDQCTCECVCQDGSFHVPTAERCLDINECATENGLCEQGCSDISGSYVCNCDIGYRLNADQLTCSDVNECAISNGGCQHTCINTDGSFYCECDIGYLLIADKKTCESYVDERKLDEECVGIYNNTCDQVCRVKNGTVVCDCEEGFQLEDDGTTCTDINECDKLNGGCQMNCTNTVGSYQCSCEPGLILQYDDHTCAEDVCELHTLCNGNGFLDQIECKCHCASGYTGDECQDKCKDDDLTCWPKYKPPQPIYGDDFCPIVCGECECKYPNCQNGGKLYKLSGYDFVPGGNFCHCYCPYPWSGKTCEDCNISCLNNGTLDGENCQCKCPVGWFGTRCETSCVQTSLMCTDHSKPHCSSYGFVAERCPILCDICNPFVTADTSY